MIQETSIIPSGGLLTSVSHDVTEDSRRKRPWGVKLLVSVQLLAFHGMEEYNSQLVNTLIGMMRFIVRFTNDGWKKLL